MARMRAARLAPACACLLALAPGCRLRRRRGRPRPARRRRQAARRRRRAPSRRRKDARCAMLKATDKPAELRRSRRRGLLPGRTATRSGSPERDGRSTTPKSRSTSPRCRRWRRGRGRRRATRDGSEGPERSAGPAGDRPLPGADRKPRHEAGLPLGAGRGPGNGAGRLLGRRRRSRATANFGWRR